MELIFCTTNSQKFAKGHAVCKEYGINLTQKIVEIDEIQSEDVIRVAQDKAKNAYALVRRPVVVSDDAWEISGLRGFPGTYAKSINTWFTVDDYLRLTRPLTDKRIIFVQSLVYQDDKSSKLFVKKIEGTLLDKARGNKNLQQFNKLAGLTPPAKRSPKSSAI